MAPYMAEQLNWTSCDLVSFPGLPRLLIAFQSEAAINSLTAEGIYIYMHLVKLTF